MQRVGSIGLFTILVVLLTVESISTSTASAVLPCDGWRITCGIACRKVGVKCIECKDAGFPAYTGTEPDPERSPDARKATPNAQCGHEWKGDLNFGLCPPEACSQQADWCGQFIRDDC